MFKWYYVLAAALVALGVVYLVAPGMFWVVLIALAALGALSVYNRAKNIDIDLDGDTQ